jgi:hypothetical protein
VPGDRPNGRWAASPSTGTVHGVSVAVCRLPSSYFQQWLVEASPSGWSSFNVPLVLRLQGPLEVAALASALRRLVARHEALRTRLRGRSPAQQQVVLDDGTLELDEVDVSTHRRRRRFLRLLIAEAERRFEVRGGPLARAVLFRLGVREHVLCLTLSHAVSDAWSSRVLAEDLHLLYAAARGEAAEPDGPALQFGDYAHWERTAPEPSREAYWRERLDPLTARLRLPGRVDPPADGPGYLSCCRPLPPVSASVVARLLEVARAQRAPVAAALGAVVVSVLAPYADGAVTVGFVTLNRAQPDLRRVVGYLANQLPVRVEVDGAPSFAEILRRFDRGLAEAYDHQLPLGRLQPLLAVSAPADRSSCFDVVVNIPTTGAGVEPVAPPARGALGISAIDLPGPRPRAAIDRIWRGSAVLDFQPRLGPGGRLGGRLVANAQAVPTDTVAMFGRAFGETLRWAAAHPASPLCGRPSERDGRS